jgi:hypothetical protein
MVLVPCLPNKSLKTQSRLHIRYYPLFHDHSWSTGVSGRWHGAEILQYGMEQKSSIWQERWSNWPVIPDKDIILKLWLHDFQRSNRGGMLWPLQNNPYHDKINMILRNPGRIWNPSYRYWRLDEIANFVKWRYSCKMKKIVPEFKSMIPCGLG